MLVNNKHKCLYISVLSLSREQKMRIEMSLHNDIDVIMKKVY